MTRLLRYLEAHLGLHLPELQYRSSNFDSAFHSPRLDLLCNAKTPFAGNQTDVTLLHSDPCIGHPQFHLLKCHSLQRPLRRMALSVGTAKRWISSRVTHFPLADATPYPILMPCQSFLGKRGTKFQSKFGPTQERDKWRVPL